MRFLALFILSGFFSLNYSFAGKGAFVIHTKEIVHTYVESTHSEDVNNALKLLEKYVYEIVLSKLQKTDKLTSNTRIYLKENKQLHPDGFVISVQKNRLTIEGGIHKGVTYGVIHLLEKYLGCRYLSPDFQIVPYQSHVSIPCQVIKDTPANDVRIINLYFPENPEYRDWLRLNTIEEIYPDGYFVHTFHRLVPRETYFQSHPEYFALVNGKRSFDQLCPSNPEVRKLIIEKLREEMAKQPQKQKWSVSQNDNFSYCKCDACRYLIEAEESPAGPIIHLVNEVAAQFPDKVISTLAYQYSRKAPVKIKPRQNVEVMLCSIELHRHLPIENDPECVSFKKDVEDWGKICSNIFLWDYTINFNHSISPFPNLHILQPNIQFFTKNHVNALFEQSNSTTGYEFSELKAYLLSRLMWNPNADIESEKQVFLNSYYGAAGPKMNEYILSLETALKETGSKLWIYEHPVVHQNGLFSEERMNHYKHLFDEAEQAVKDDPVSLNHVQLARLPIQYAEMEIAANNMFSKRGWYELKDGKAIPNLQLRETLDAFEQTCLRNAVPTVNEAELTPSDYIRSMRSMMDVNIEGNKAFGKKVSASVPPDKKYLNGDLSYLTNGVNGASDYNIHWLGWSGTDTELILDLDSTTTAQTISIHSLWNAKSWILHPASVSCSVSADGKHYVSIGTLRNEGEQQQEEPIHSYTFETGKQPFRYVKLTVQGTKTLFNWHPSAGGDSWFFLDEITITN